MLSLIYTAAVLGAGPCDIYQTGGTPCMAAHSTVRALYGAYSGPLYTVKRCTFSKGENTIITTTARARTHTHTTRTHAAATASLCLPATLAAYHG